MEQLLQGPPPGWKFSIFDVNKLLSDPARLMEETATQHGDPFTVWSPGKSVTLTAQPEGIKEIFTADPDILEPFGNDTIRPFVGSGSILLMSGERHKAERKLLMPPFHGARMRAYGRIIEETALDQLRQYAVGNTFPVMNLTQATSLLVIIRAIFGVRSAEDIERVRELTLQKIDAMSPWLVFFPPMRQEFFGLGPWARFKKASEQADAYLIQEMDRKRSTGQLGDDILSLMLQAQYEDGEHMTNEHIVSELTTLLFAGHETTAITLAWAMHWLHALPQVRERVLEELASLGEHPEPENIARLPYLSAVVDETLRIYPIVPLAAREVKTNFKLRGWELPAGSVVGAAIALLHRNPELYPEPMTFRPERFLERSFSPFEYIPFGGGTRRCIGAAFSLYETKLVLATWLRHATFELKSTVTPKLERRNVTLSPLGGVPLTLTSLRA